MTGDVRLMLATDTSPGLAAVYAVNGIMTPHLPTIPRTGAVRTAGRLQRPLGWFSRGGEAVVSKRDAQGGLRVPEDADDDSSYDLGAN